jgi:hypothetical protein
MIDSPVIFKGVYHHLETLLSLFTFHLNGLQVERATAARNYLEEIGLLSYVPSVP